MLKKKLKENGIEFYRGRPYGNIIEYRSNIFDTAQNLIMRAQHRIILSTYEFEKKSKQAEKIFDSVIMLNNIIEKIAYDNYIFNNNEDNFDKLSKKNKQKFARLSGYTIPLRITLSTDRPILFLKNIRNWVDAEIIPRYSNKNFLKNTIKLLKKSPYIKFNYEYHTHWEFDTNHAKYIVVDNKTLIGSSNINDRSYFEAARIIEGDITNAVVDSFYRDIYRRFSKIKKISYRSRLKRVSRTLRKGRFKKIKRSRKQHGKGNYFIVTTPSTKMISIRINKFYSNQKIFLRIMFSNVRRTIKLYTPNLNYKGFEKDIIGAINRGVSVKIILSQNFGDYAEKKDGGTNQQSVDKLMKLYEETTEGELQIGYYRDHNVPTGDEKKFRKKEKNLSHIKMYIFDDICSLWGSMNLDNQSFRSHELSIGSFDKKQVREDVKFFNKIFHNTVRT